MSANPECSAQEQEAIGDALFWHIDEASQLCEGVVGVLHNLVSI
jgi:hypothetical protein